MPESSDELSHAARATAAIGTLMAVWWMTEAIPLAATALLPVLLLPIAGVFPTGEGLPSAIRQAAAPYGHEYIFLFLGGFLIARAIERWGLHRRIALMTVSAVGTQPTRLIGGFMLATAGLSMWISNTATTVMMLPIALSVVSLVDERVRAESPDEESAIAPFATCLLIAVAYAASIGGIATLIGTPPNVFLAGYLKDDFGVELSFGRWLAAIGPMCAVLLVITWLLLTRVVFRSQLTDIPGGRQLIRGELRKLGSMSRGELTVLCVFLLTASLWILRGPLGRWELFASNFPAWRHVHDSGIAIFGALLLFVIPIDLKRGIFALDWETGKRLPWGVLLLFGGGLSLASAVSKSGLADWIGHQLPEGIPVAVIVVLSTTVVIFLTEMSSNLATVSVFLPILGALAVARGVDPRWIVIPAGIAASCAFMLPVATPPNAIVFGSGRVRIGDMARAGLWLNLVSVIWVPLYMWLIGAWALGLR
jgi:sodium-dependent dicarboxylate transporter 2/3/5